MDHLTVYPIGSAGGDGDLLPKEALRRLCRGHRPFLLDGASDADQLGRYSYGGCDPVASYRDRQLDPPGGPLWKAAPDRLDRRAPALPLLRLQQVVARWTPLVTVGLLGYDLGRSVERLPGRNRPDDLGVAPIDVAGYEALYRHDARTGASAILAVSEAAAARLRRRLLSPPPPLPAVPIGAARFETSREEYCRRVRCVRDYLLAGDCYQVNLCHRIRAPLPQAAALPTYLRLRQVAPAPLGTYLQLDADDGSPGAVLLSNSPELLLLLDLERGQVQTRPIKGTRRRGPGPAADRAAREELLHSDKDLAEHLMIVDLLRNDLGRVATIGSVRVEGHARLLELPTVHHLVSTVLARLAPGVGLEDVLTAVLPGGSITGAPKVRAMEIIDELEPVRRGPFYGAVGWITPTAAALALCIRTALVRDDELMLSVGGGIVVDSTPEGEYEETEIKAAAFLRALS